MAKRIIDINPYVRTQRDRIDRIVHSSIASARIDGIKVHEGEARRMTSKAVKQYSDRE